MSSTGLAGCYMLISCWNKWW